MKENVKKILIIKTSSLGDVVHCLPVIHDIRQHLGEVQIDWVVEEAFADIPKLHPHINQVFTVAMRRWRRHLFAGNTWQEVKKSKQLLSLQAYDAVIDTQGLLKSAVIAYFARGEKYGYDKHSIREPLASYFYDEKYSISYQQHAVKRNRALCAMSLGYATPNDAPNYGISATGTSIDLPNNFVIGLHGTSRDSKLWPVENWVSLGKELAIQNLNLALPWASQAEFERANLIASKLSNASVLPKLSIAQIAGVIAKAQAAVGVDTGLSHLAAALNIPTIAIYTNTNPALTGVMGGAFKPAVNLGGIVQTPSVEEVLKNLQKIL